ncbi:MAG: HD domain-containing phosphohydrolase [Terracoccus sp.]
MSDRRPPSTTQEPVYPRRLLVYIAVVSAGSLLLGALSVLGAMSGNYGRSPELAPLVLLCGMGVVSFNLREPDVGSRVGFSFLSIIMLSSAAIVGPLGAWIIGVVSVAIDRKAANWFQVVFNMAMASMIGAAGGWVYVFANGATDFRGLTGAEELALQVGLPLMLADVVGCLINALLISGILHFYQRVPFVVAVRGLLVSSGVAYIGYGIIGFLFVILWFPAHLGAFSAILIMAPLLAARWAFIQYGEEMRSHERTVDTLVTALGTKEPPAIARSQRAATLAAWVAEELGLRPHQIGVVRHAATLHEIGHLGVPTRILRRVGRQLDSRDQFLLDRHADLGSQMIEGIDFLEDARSGIRHQDEHFDGSGPAGLAGDEIPIAARIVAVVAGFDELTRGDEDASPRMIEEALRVLEADGRRWDPLVVAATREALAAHRLQTGTVVGGAA